MSIGIAKPTPSAVPERALDLRVDPDHAAVRVEERPARVAAVDRRVDLDRVRDAERGVSESIERPVAETTPTESEVCLPNGLPIAATGSPTTTRDGVAERDGRERVVGRRDADDADVAEEIPADDLAPRRARRPRTRRRRRCAPRTVVRRLGRRS